MRIDDFARSVKAFRRKVEIDEDVRWRKANATVAFTRAVPAHARALDLAGF